MNEKYISIEAAIAEIKADAGCANCYVKMPGRCLACEAGRKIRRIEEIRPANVRSVKEGVWITPPKNRDYSHLVDFYECPFCGYVEDCLVNFCPNCGADMTGSANG